MTIGYYAFQASNLQLLEVRAGGLPGSKAKLLGSRHGLLIDEGTATVEHRSESRTIKRQSQSQKPTYLGKIPILDHFDQYFSKYR